MDQTQIDAARKLADEVRNTLPEIADVDGLADLVDQLADELEQAQATVKVLAHDLGVADAKANHLREQLATRAKVSDEDFKTILAAHQRARLTLKQYAEPWNWDVVDGHRRLWAGDGDGPDAARSALRPEACKVPASPAPADGKADA